MKKIRFQLLSTISLLLCLSALAVWLAETFDPYASLFHIPIRDHVIAPGPHGLTLYRHGWMAVFAIPYWLTVAALAALPLVWLVRNPRPNESRTACAVRRLCSTACFISLLLFGGAAALWIGSYFIAESFTLKTAHYLYDVNSLMNPHEDADGPTYLGWIREDSIRTKRGTIAVRLQRSVDHLMLGADNVKDWSQDYPPGHFFVWERGDPHVYFHFEGIIVNETPTVVFNRFGFFLGTSDIPGISAIFTNFRSRDVAIPLWIIAALTGVSPGLRVLNWLRSRRRARPGFCAKCGYNLTGNVSGTCPECGALIGAQTKNHSASTMG